jgi:hypothetical protein
MKSPDKVGKPEVIAPQTAEWVVDVVISYVCQ